MLPAQEAAYRVFIKNVQAQGGRVVETQWLGKDKPHRVICAEGHACAPRPGNVRSGGGICRICTGNDPKRAEASFVERLALMGAVPVYEKWGGALKPHGVRCANGHYCTPRPSGVSQGQGVCRICAKQDPETAERLFKEKLKALGAKPLYASWNGVGAPHAVMCKNNHLCFPWPTSVQQGRGVCRICKGSTWNVFYIVRNPVTRIIKFGVTSDDFRDRLNTHKRAGYVERLRVKEALNDAVLLERNLIQALRDAGTKPVRGREYFPESALGLILDITDNWQITGVAA